MLGEGTLLSNSLNFKFLEGSQSAPLPFLTIIQVSHGQTRNRSSENQTFHLAHNTQVLSHIFLK